jgi:hypothetical protein
MFGCLFTIRLGGWRIFCQEHHLDPELLWSCLPGFDTIKRAEEAARNAAFVGEGAVRWVEERNGGKPGGVATAETVAANLRALFQN